MIRKIIETADGSKTLYLPGWDEHYHSKFGAFTESMHIFIENGCRYVQKSEISTLEVGFGTGLNALLTFQEAQASKRKVYYEGVEKYPLSTEETGCLGYQGLAGDINEKIFSEIHACKWEEEIVISPFFCLKKTQIDLLGYQAGRKFDIIYFDAFAPDLQPDLWSPEIFKKLFSCLNPGGVLVTYSTKGIVKRNLTSAGFTIEKLKGPPGGKREILRAVKLPLKT